MDQLSGIEGLRGAVEKEGRRSMNLFEVVWHFARVERDPWLSPLPLWTRGWTAPTSTMISRPPRTHLHSPPTPTRKCDFGRDVGCDRLVLAKDASVSFTPLCMCNDKSKCTHRTFKRLCPTGSLTPSMAIVAPKHQPNYVLLPNLISRSSPNSYPNLSRHERQV